MKVEQNIIYRFELTEDERLQVCRALLAMPPGTVSPAVLQGFGAVHLDQPAEAVSKPSAPLNLGNVILALPED